MKTKKLAVIFALLAAALYAINVPLSKILLENVTSTIMAGLLYFGAGVGLALYCLIGKAAGKNIIKDPLTKAELPYTLAMIILDIAAPILLMLGITNSHSASVSLLNNFEIVATTLIAAFIFKEAVSKHLSFAIALVVLSSAILSFEGQGSLKFSLGSLYVLGACLCWGIENNCTRKLSSKSSIQITMIKGIFSGLGSLAVAFVVGERLPSLMLIAFAMLLGFVSYGLSINFYILAQKHIGAAKTSAYYAVAPFLGVAFSMLLLGERPALNFYVALAIMIIATVIIVRDTLAGE